MKRVLLALALVGLMSGAAYAQDQHDLTGGVLICHAPPGLEWTSSVGDWCAELVIDDCCADQVNQIDFLAEGRYVWYIISNFYESKCFNAIEYGIEYDPGLYVEAYVDGGVCAPYEFSTIEYPSSGSWPLNGSAIAIALNEGEWCGTCVATSYIFGYYTGTDVGMINLVPSPATSFIGWVSATGSYAPDCIGSMGLGQPGTWCCSEPPPMMACCLQDGSCVDVMTEQECLDMGGILYPDNYCDEPGFECPQPPEPQACCFPDGSCVDMLEQDCIDAGGVFYPDNLCDDPDFECPILLMACCLEDGSCVDVMTEQECLDMGGILYPDNYCDEPGFECPQPPPEFACCFDFDEACYMMTEQDCIDAGGTWYDGMVCESAGGDFNCPLWRVCCVGVDCYITTETGCADMGGDWHPEWDSCDPNPCEVTPADPSSWGSIKSMYR